MSTAIRHKVKVRVWKYVALLIPKAGALAKTTIKSEPTWDKTT